MNKFLASAAASVRNVFRGRCCHSPVSRTDPCRRAQILASLGRLSPHPRSPLRSTSPVCDKMQAGFYLQAESSAFESRKMRLPTVASIRSLVSPQPSFDTRKPTLFISVMPPLSPCKTKLPPSHSILHVTSLTPSTQISCFGPFRSVTATKCYIHISHIMAIRALKFFAVVKFKCD